ncbi:MAG: site-specific integrase [Pirellulaceae bacterium]|nr:site-specific integrase [Pirellulaceae bacterium]
MASLFKKKIMVCNPKTGKKVPSWSRKWWGQYRDENKKLRRKPLAQDKAAATAMLQKLVRKVELRVAGVTDCFDDHRAIPLAKHIDEFIEYLHNKGNIKTYVSRTQQMLRDIVDACKFTMMTQISASAVQSFLGSLRNDGYSVNSVNHYLRAAKMFSRWLFRDHRNQEDRLMHLRVQNPETDRRRIRRPLSTEELSWLLLATQRARSNQGISGSDRVILYILACYTGFRRNELGSITERSFNFESKPPQLTVAASFSKRRKNDVIPLRSDLAERIQGWLALRTDRDDKLPLIGISNKRTGEMLKRDLAFARKLWLAEITDEQLRKKAEASSFLCFIDVNGRYADFHALRKTFITNLSKSGVSPKMAQSLARHSDINLTMNVYTDVVLEDQAIAVESLPQLPPATPLPPPPPVQEPGIYKHLAKMRAQAERRVSSKKRLEEQLKKSG